MKYIRNETLEDRECAVFEANIDMSEMDLPDEIKGKRESSFVSKGTYWFDIQNRYFIKSEIETKDNMLMDLNDDGYMSTESSSIIQIRFKGIEK